jgi:hypothetical protein
VRDFTLIRHRHDPFATYSPINPSDATIASDLRPGSGPSCSAIAGTQELIAKERQKQTAAMARPSETKNLCPVFTMFGNLSPEVLPCTVYAGVSP